MNNETDIGIKFSASVNGNKKLQELATSLSMIKGVADGLNTGAINSIEVGSNEMKEISKNTKTTANVMKLAFNFSTVRMFARTLGNVTRELTRLANKSSEYLENVNLFQVAFDGNYRSAERFINKISEMYGLDESRITRVVGIFKQLSNAMNVSAETGERLATLMTQMSLDISSLYNVDFERATSVLQSAISGQTKPIRGTTGADITQSTLQTTLDSLGIDRAVNQLTFAEKRLLIIISLTQQLKEATNDLGRTIESPANQLKVLSEQWQRLSRALGNTFLPILAKILPYLNAIMMVLTEIINMIAKLFGYKEEDYDYFAGTDEAVQDLEDSLGKATAGVGKLKKALSGLRSFDKLNVITTPSNGGAGGGAGSGLGTAIDPDILKAFNNAFDSYNDKLTNVKMKATQIRDAIMEWLGFTKEIDPLTGKIIWKYQGIKTTLNNIWKWFKNLSPLAKTLVSYFAYLFGSKVLSGAKKLIGLFTNITPIKTMNTEFGKMVKYIGVWSSATKSKKDGLIMGIDQWKAEASAMERIQTALGGLITTGLGLGAIKKSMDSINDSGLNLLNTLGLVGGELSSTFGGAMMGASIGGGWGAVIGGIAGAISGLVTALWNYETEQDKIAKKSKETLKNIQDSANELQKSIANTELEITASMSMTHYHEGLVKELDNIIDKNGDIKKGYEDRAKYILDELSKAYGVEYELLNNNLKNSQDFTEEIKKQIQLKQQEIILEGYKDMAVQAMKDKVKYYGELYDATLNQKNTLEDLNKVTGKYGMTYNEFMEELNKTNGKLDLSNKKHQKMSAILSELLWKHNGELKAIKNYNKSVKESGDTYQKNADLVTRYSNYQSAILTGDMDKITEAMNELTSVYIKDGQIIEETSSQTTNRLAEDYKTDLTNMKENNQQKYDEWVNNLKSLAVSVDEITPEIAQKFAGLGRTSTDDFVTAMEDLPIEVQQKVVSKMAEQGLLISQELQKGIDKLDPTVKVKTEVTGIKSALEKLSKFPDISQKVISGEWTVKYAMQKAGLYGTGGLPPVGQIFVANEKGPELVGQIGGQSFVANQNQMMDLIDKKIGNAQGNNKSNDVYNIYLDANHKIGSYTLEQLQGMAKTNGKPISIG